MKSPKVLQLKDEGHRLIDKLVADGVKRAKVYRRLAKRLKVPEHDAHYSQMNSIARLTRANQALRDWIEQREKSKAAPPNPPGSRRRNKGQILPREAQIEAFRQLRLARMPWWRRWAHKLWHTKSTSETQ